MKDLQSEFEFDRNDYLDAIRSQDRQIKYLQGIIDRIHPALRRDCNYTNLDRIQAQAAWDPVSEQWILPKLTVEKISLPAAGRGSAISLGEVKLNVLK